MNNQATVQDTPRYFSTSVEAEAFAAFAPSKVTSNNKLYIVDTGNGFIIDVKGFNNDWLGFLS